MRRTGIVAALLTAFSLQGAAAAEPGQLTVAGPDQTGRVLDLESLDAMRQVTFRTSTIWTDGTATFSGVPLSEIVRFEVTEGRSLRMTALNDYAIELPLSEVSDDVPIVATRIDGRTLSVREKGPYWVVYPYDADEVFQTETIYARSIWQLHRIDVLP